MIKTNNWKKKIQIQLLLKLNEKTKGLNLRAKPNSNTTLVKVKC